jgi:hypothetical protein
LTGDRACQAAETGSAEDDDDDWAGPGVGVRGEVRVERATGRLGHPELGRERIKE